MLVVDTLENIEIELGKLRKAASRVDDPLILYLFDMTILAVKRKAISECSRSRETSRRNSSQVPQPA